MQSKGVRETLAQTYSYAIIFSATYRSDEKNA